MLKALTQALNAPAYHENISALSMKMRRGPRQLQCEENYDSTEKTVGKGRLWTVTLGIWGMKEAPAKLADMVSLNLGA